MATSFAASVKDWAERTKAAQEEVMRQSVQDVVEVMLTPEGSGGKFPVDVGFLINSLASGIGDVTFATTAPAFEGDVGGGGPGSDYTLTILQMEPGDVARFALTAEYAMRMENGFHGTDSAGRTIEQYGRHFMSSAAAQWPQIVAANAEKFKP